MASSRPQSQCRAGLELGRANALLSTPSFDTPGQPSSNRVGLPAKAHEKTADGYPTAVVIFREKVVSLEEELTSS